MTNILSTLRGSGIFCVKLVRNTSKLLSRILNFYANTGDGHDNAVTHETYNDKGDNVLPAATDPNFRWPSKTSSYVPDAPSRSDSQCSCLSCAIPPTLSDLPRRPSRLIEGVSAEKFYRFGELLGEGTFSKVYLAEALSMPGGLVAIKVIDKSSLIRKKVPATGPVNVTDEVHVVDDKEAGGVEEKIITDPEDDLDDAAPLEEYEDLRWLIDREIQIMSALDHPHIIHLAEVYEDDDKVYFILELAKGGEVFDRLVEKVTFTEVEAADLLVQLLCAVGFMHQQGIVHRDLKLENLLYYDDTEDSKILVADFGLSEYEWELKEGSPVCGTPGYLAPEVIARQPCTASADVWSIGVIAYILLAGYPPFFANPDEPDTDATLFKKILTGDYKFHDNAWSHISPEARDFIRCLLCPDPLQRPTCEEALGHPWLNDRQNLELRSAATRGGLAHAAATSLATESDEDRWSASQHAAFALSLAIILYSYIGLLTYVFNIGGGDGSESKAGRFFEPLETFLLALFLHLTTMCNFLMDSFSTALSTVLSDFFSHNFIDSFK